LKPVNDFRIIFDGNRVLDGEISKLDILIALRKERDEKQRNFDEDLASLANGKGKAFLNFRLEINQK